MVEPMINVLCKFLFYQLLMIQMNLKLKFISPKVGGEGGDQVDVTEKLQKFEVNGLPTLNTTTTTKTTTILVTKSTIFVLFLVQLKD